MSKVIEAVFENGVLKPVKKLRLKDKQQVKIQILNDEDWQERFDRVLKSIRSKAARFSPEQIEADIARAIKEVMETKRGHRKCSLDGIIDIAKDCADTDLSVHHDKYLYGSVPTPARKKIIKLKGILKVVDITEKDIISSKKSLDKIRHIL
ncbi:MAG: hypothetical protein A2Y97_04310 [Nitrospirae bacterium RBG_13_39_12]|nr:MAG: hypothetical protein A2Y97_04310 [Nitrospirae bacterium RBG_13_39_12]